MSTLKLEPRAGQKLFATNNAEWTWLKYCQDNMSNFLFTNMATIS